MRVTAVCVLVAALATVCSAQAAAGKAENAAAREDISGMYSFLEEGEFVQINLEGSLVTGFISRYGEGERVMFLDHFFKTAALKGNELTFTTKTVHGVWFDFKGRVQRGEGKTRPQEGYYVIKGSLTQSATDASKKVSSKSREVTFRSFPDELEPSPPK